ncbi:MAG TPA: prepilin peptidase [Vitreimonas sp.]|nr:prepilin peptidase [Vitreimonas sp.]
MMLIVFGLVSLFLFWAGAALGSFLNVVIYRTMTEESWVTGRSKCDHCGKQIAWYDNIPLLSFLILRGRCRRCHKPISIIHPVVESLTGILFVWWYWVGFIFFQLTQHPLQTLQPLFWLLVGVLLLVIFFADLLYMLIPDVIVGLLLLMTICYRLALVLFGAMQLPDLLWSVGGAVLAGALFGGLWWITKGKGMGFGDVKFSVPMALLLGWPNIMVGIFLAFLIGALAGVSLIAGGRRRFGQVIPFGPFLVIATFITLVWGDSLVQWYVGLL